MEGFFSKKQTESTVRPDGKILSCAACGLYKNVENPKLKPHGNFKKKILNIGDFPTKNDDTNGYSFSGRYERMLRKIYKKQGIDFVDDCITINAVNCYTSTAPTSHQIHSCRNYVIGIIKEYQPDIIILFGSAALESIIGSIWKRNLGTINKWRGYIIPDQQFNAFICPVFSPRYVDKEEIEISTIWEQDLHRALSNVGKKILQNKEPNIHIIDDLSIFETDKSIDIIAFDYETTGLKPHAKGHKIICASVAIDENTCYVFEIPKKRKDTQPFLKLLGNPFIKKMAHNMKYEDTWSIVKLRQHVENWYWDSMVAAKILDNRNGVVGLKFQTYVNFGIVDYASEVTPYLTAKDSKNGNAINKIDKLWDKKEGKEKILKYCALDSIYQFRLSMLQMKALDFKNNY